MYPIIESGPVHGRGMAPQDFEERFLEVCAQHRAEGRALVFALILCDFEQPQVLHVLQDDAYWQSLDTVSGNRISVFAFHAPTRPGDDSPMSFWLESGRNPGERARSLVHRYFDLGPSLRLPSVIFFQASERGVSDAVVVPIRSERTEDAFLEIKDAIAAASTSLSQVEDQYRGNSAEMFGLVRGALQNRGAMRGLKRATRYLPNVLRALAGGD